MYAILVVFTNTVYFLISALQLLMLVRALMSWFPIDEEGMLYRFVTVVTEPVILPVRAVLEKFEFMRNLPLDLSLFISFMLLSILQLILPRF